MCPAPRAPLRHAALKIKSCRGTLRNRGISWSLLQRILRSLVSFWAGRLIIPDGSSANDGISCFSVSITCKNYETSIFSCWDLFDRMSLNLWSADLSCQLYWAMGISCFELWGISCFELWGISCFKCWDQLFVAVRLVLIMDPLFWSIGSAALIHWISCCKLWNQLLWSMGSAVLIH